MWTISQGVDRRRFLTIGAAGLGVAGCGQLSLPALLRAEEATGKRRAVINIHLDGGPPHMDLIDPKPTAPTEIRGEFQPLATTIPGLQLTELMPRVAGAADQFVFIRSLVGSEGKHHAFQCQSGFDEKNMASIGGRPAMGCVLSKVLGRPDDPAPTFVDLMQGRPLVRNSARPGFLGPAYKPFRPDLSKQFQRPLEAGMKGELKRLGANHSTELKLGAHLDAERLNDRTALLAQLDKVKRNVDGSGMMAALDRFQQQAVGILTSGSLAEALDLGRVSAKELRRYTADVRPLPGALQSTTSEDGQSIRKFLLARRLIEAGARCVSVSISDFDTHSSNFPRMRHLGPIVDFGLQALVADLSERGMLDDVLIVAWGEFGRTPRIDPKNGGRHHWPRVGMAMLAGGGLKTGQVIGATDRTASAAIQRPVTHQDIFATIYEWLGVSLSATTLRDPSGRPQYLVENGEPLRELL